MPISLFQFQPQQKITGMSIPLLTCVTNDVSALTLSILRNVGIGIIQIEALSTFRKIQSVLDCAMGEFQHDQDVL